MQTLSIINCQITASIDTEDHERLSKFLWYKVGSETHFVIARYIPYEHGIIHINLACEVMSDLYSMFDHIDRNPFNNQKLNLRKCSYSQNLMNRAKTWSGTSKYKGVAWDNNLKKYRVRVSSHGKQYSGGIFDNDKEAAKSANILMQKHHGEFAVLNVIDDESTLVDDEEGSEEE